MDKSSSINILFCGVGGQGVVKASDVCGWAALFEGYQVKKSETHGMAQRSGSVESHLRFGTKVFSPLIPCGQADYLVPFQREEDARLKKFLRAQGVDLIAYLKKGEALFHNTSYVNTFLLGVLSRYLPIQEENWLKAIEVVFTPEKSEKNKEVFLQGRGVSHDLE